MLQAQRRLDQSRHASCRLEVADIALDRADHAAVLGTSALAVGRADRGRLDRIADRSAGAVRFDVLHAVRSDMRPSRSASTMFASCDAWFGSEMPAVRPSWLTAVARINA